MSRFEEYASFDGLGLVEPVRKGEVQPTELVEPGHPGYGPVG